jgi:histidyl-tRNA synthetase
MGVAAGNEAMGIADRLREKGSWVELGDHGASLKSQLRKADRLSAGYVFILGEDELKSGVIKWKRLADSTQGEIALAGIDDFLAGVRTAG